MSSTAAQLRAATAGPRPAAGPRLAVPPDTWVVIPAYNEGDVLGAVLQRVLTVCPNVVVVDDGSPDHTAAAAIAHPVHLLRHAINLGQGAALQTGLGYALAQGAEYLVTFDADGQMDETEIAALCAAISTSTADVALGSRFLRRAPSMPRLRRLLIRTATLFTRLTTGLRLTDTHNGFRAFSRPAAREVHLKQNGMAHASEILHTIARRRWRYVEVPVSIRYTEYSLAKGQSLLNSINILWDLVFH
jgi:polyprenyl-phospho-N-acetylgalactosaminyl synthase